MLSNLFVRVAGTGEAVEIAAVRDKTGWTVRACYSYISATGATFEEAVDNFSHAWESAEQKQNAKLDKGGL